MDYLILLSRCIAAGTLLASSLPKIINFASFTRAVGELDLLGKAKTTIVAAVVVVAEFTIAVISIPNATAEAGLILATGLFLSFTAVAIRAARRSNNVRCWCFGPSPRPLGYPQAVRNLSLVVMTGGAAAAGLYHLPTTPAPLANVLLTVLLGLVVVIPVVSFDDLIVLFSAPSPTDS